jgi:hypothetical protein
VTDTPDNGQDEPVTVEQMLDGIQPGSVSADWGKGPKVARLIEKIITNRNKEGTEK